MAEQRAGARDRSRDQVLLAELSGMLDRVDPPPGWLVELARLSHGLRLADLEVAELVADSQVDRPAVAVRAAVEAEPRLLTLESDTLLVDLQVGQGEGGPALAGQVVPARRATVELRQPGRGTVTVTTDGSGRFTVSGLAPGPLSLLCRWAGSAVLLSPWLLV